MKVRLLALAVPFLLTATNAVADGPSVRWPLVAAGRIAADAATSAPPDFQRMLARHPRRLMDGVKAGLAASPAREPQARRAALASGARRLAEAIRGHRPFADVAFEAGGLVAEAALLLPPPAASGGDDALLALARGGATFLGFTPRPFDSPEAIAAAPLPSGTPREAYDSALTLSARLLAWTWHAAGGDAAIALARPESKGPYPVR